MSFLNRDHIVAVTIEQDSIIVVMTSGTRFLIPASAATAAAFAEELAHDIGSNFASIASQLRTL
jgi:hypothetical protein